MGRREGLTAATARADLPEGRLPLVGRVVPLVAGWSSESTRVAVRMVHREDRIQVVDPAVLPGFPIPAMGPVVLPDRQVQVGLRAATVHLVVWSSDVSFVSRLLLGTLLPGL